MLFRLLLFAVSLPFLGKSQFTDTEIFFNGLQLKDGLSSYNIKKIIHDKYKFTWIATQDGLNCFDGNSFQVYNRSSPTADRRILGNDITDIAEDTINNILWTSTSYGGLNGINLINRKVEISVSSLQAQGHLLNQWIKCIAICSGKIWVGTNDGIDVYNPITKQFEDGISVPFKKSEKIKNINADLFFTDEYNRVWIFFQNLGLVIYDGNNLKVLSQYTAEDFKLPFIKEYKVFNTIAKLAPGKVLVGTHAGFVKISYNNSDRIGISSDVGLNKNFKGDNISSIAKDRQNNIWFSTTDKLFKADAYLSQAAAIKPIDNAGKRTNLNSIFSIYFDQQNYIWLGTVKEVLYSKNKSINFLPIYQSLDTKLRIDHPYYIYPVTDSFVYVCASDGFYSVDLKKGRFAKIDSNKSYYYIYQFKDFYFVASEKGMHLYLPNKNKMVLPQYFFKELYFLRDELINCIIPDADSVLLLASETANGFYSWDYKNHVVRNFNSSTNSILAGSDIVNTMYKDVKGDIWLLGDNQIAIYSPKTSDFNIMKWTDSAGQLYSIYFDMCETKEYYWIAAYGTGVIQVDKNMKIKKVFGISDGLLNTGVYRIINKGDSTLYVSTNNGIYLLNTKTHTCKGYYESDGLNSSAFEGWCGYQKNGFIYFGGDKGFTVINTKQRQNENPIPPILYINRVYIETSDKTIDTTNLKVKQILVPENYNQITLYFSGINYSNPSRTIYSYKISEIQDHWINIESQNFLTLIGLSPGTYHLQVKAANEDGVWSEPKELVLVFLPKWYQTWWFYALIVLTVAAILYALYRYRIHQIKKQHEIRKNIATDLHDDLGSTLNSVKVFTNLAISGVKQEESLQQVKDNLTEATMSLRDMIWVLDDSLDTVDELVTRLKQFALPITAASNMEFVINAGSDVNARTLSKEEKRNLFLICKEVINNSIKYSGASKITVDLLPAGKKIQITVADNGKGFDEATVKKGYGLKNMQYRAGQVKYKAVLSSQQEKGTSVVIAPV